MKLPEIHGKNKIRDADICHLYAEGWSAEEIVTFRKLSICARRVEQILYRNRGYVTIDKDWEKIKRINILKQEVRRSKPSRKDRIEIVEQLRKEVDGDKNDNSGRTETRIILVTPSERQHENRPHSVTI